MAIINSLAIGKSVKSAGNLTYKTVRGRTIASQRITQNKSNTAAQQEQRSRFAGVSISMKLIQRYIDVCYEKSKYGSSRNAFFKANKNFNFGGLYGELEEGLVTLSDAMLSALTNYPIKQLSALSWGSLAGFLTIRYNNVESYKYGENTYENLKVIATADGSSYSPGEYDFVFSSPVRKSDLKLYFFGFSDNGLITDIGSLNVPDMGTFEFDNSKVVTAANSCRAYFAGDTHEFIESIHVEIDLSSFDACPIAVVVPVAGGKVPTIAGVFAKTSAV